MDLFQDTSDMDYYAVTIKYNGSDISDPVPSTYEPFITLLQSKGCIIRYIYYEPDSKGRCHLHGSIYIPKKLYRKNLKIPKYHIKMVEIFDNIGWEEYCRKNQQRGDISPPDINMTKLKKRLF